MATAVGMTKPDLIVRGSSVGLESQAHFGPVQFSSEQGCFSEPQRPCRLLRGLH